MGEPLTNAVMPAEAGIQYIKLDFWIPAFAGMTKQVILLAPMAS